MHSWLRSEMNQLKTAVGPDFDQKLAKIFWSDQEFLVFMINYLLIKIDSLHPLYLIPSEWAFCADKPTNEVEHLMLARGRVSLPNSKDGALVSTLT